MPRRGFREADVLRVCAGAEALGTAHALGNGRFVTARHVIDGRAPLSLFTESGKKVAEVELCWPRGKNEEEAGRAVDIAILANANASRTARRPVCELFGGLSGTADPRAREWSARGFPALIGGKATTMSGRVQRGQDNGRIDYQVEASTHPPEAAKWKGVSGAGAFIDDELWGVVARASGFFAGGLLEVVAITDCLDLSGFRAALGLPDPESLSEVGRLAEALYRADLEPYRELRSAGAVPHDIPQEASDDTLHPAERWHEALRIPGNTLRAPLFVAIDEVDKETRATLRKCLDRTAASVQRWERRDRPRVFVGRGPHGEAALESWKIRWRPDSDLRFDRRWRDIIGLTAPVMADLAQADEYRFIHTSELDKDSLSGREIEYAVALRKLRERHEADPKPAIKTVVVGEDPIPEALEGSPTRRDPAAGGTHGAAWLGLLLALAATYAGIEMGEPVLRFLALLLIGVGILLLQYRGHSRAVAEAAKQLTGFLREATVADTVAGIDAFFRWVFGPRLLSGRAAGVSLGLSLLFFVIPGAILLPFWLQDSIFELSDVVVPAAVIAMPLSTAGVDFGSLLVTRSLLRWAQQRPSNNRLLVALAVDALAAMALVVGPVAAAGAFHYSSTLELQTGRPTGWLEAVGLSSWYAVEPYETRVVNFTRSPFPAVFVLTGVWAISAAVPSLLLGVSIVVGWTLKLRWPAIIRRRFGHVASWLGDNPRRGISALYLGTVATVCALLPLPRAMAEPPETPEFQRVSQRVEPQPESVHGRDRPVCIQRTEVTQAWWADVWERSVFAQRAGLPRTPSTFYGRRRPVESVSWCETARFLNAWSLLEQRNPAYCVPVESDPDCSDLTVSGRSSSFALVGCEENARIRLIDGAGFRLPDDDEFSRALELATVRASPFTETDWLPSNAGFRTHRVGELGGDRGLVDVAGNVAEWMHDQYQAPIRDAGRSFPRGTRRGSAWFISNDVRPRESIESWTFHSGGTWAYVGFRAVFISEDDDCDPTNDDDIAPNSQD